MTLRPGTLYGALDRLVEQGLVVQDGEEVVDAAAVFIDDCCDGVGSGSAHLGNDTSPPGCYPMGVASVHWSPLASVLGAHEKYTKGGS